MSGFGGARRILEDLRGARVLVVHPNDEDGTVLVDHLRRLGCEVRAIWPLPHSLPDNFDTLFIQLDEQPVPEALSAAIEDKAPAIIAIVTYESPTSLKAIIDINAHGVISKPLRLWASSRNSHWRGIGAATKNGYRARCKNWRKH